MPIYPYKCPKCETKVEIQRRVAEKGWSVVCAICKKEMKPIFASFVNDYRPTHSRFVKTVDDW